jgi:hypothetical protein
VVKFGAGEIDYLSYLWVCTFFCSDHQPNKDDLNLGFTSELSVVPWKVLW